MAAFAAACSAGNSTPAVPGVGSTSTSLLQPASLRPASWSWANLRSAESFAILAGSTVTSTGATRIDGNVGIYPGTAITGFGPGKINGNLHAGDPTAKQAEMDLATFYAYATRPLVTNPVTVAGNIGGQTLYAGVYKSTSSLAISSGDLTLDGRGHASAVFLFQIASSLTLTTGRKVILTHGAQASNVFWLVGSSATLGTGCTFDGTLVAAESISIATGSTMVGRALARIGAVTLQGNTIVRPPPLVRN